MNNSVGNVFVGNCNENFLKKSLRIKRRESLVPAAAAIPAPQVCTNFAVVKKFVVAPLAEQCSDIYLCL